MNGPVKYSKRRTSSFRTRVATLMLGAVIAGGCIVPVPRKTIVGTGGTGKTSDLEIRKSGSATREDIQQKLGFIDTGTSTVAFFWGRYIRKWDIIWVAKDAAGTIEKWGIRNLIVEFSETDLVTRWNIFDDGDIPRKLIPFLKRPNANEVDVPPVPSSCPFQWREVMRVSTKSPKRKDQGEDLINVEFEALSQNNKVGCKVDMPPQSAFAVIADLVSTGQESVFDARVPSAASRKAP